MKSELAESVGGFLANLEASKVKKTFVFVDIFNSTEHKLIRPDTAWVPAMAEFYRMVVTSVETFGGTLVKFLGDGAMASFERAEDALRSSIALQEELDKRRRSNSTELRCKIGIATGEAYGYKTADERYDYLGSVVDLAARLCSYANGNAILLSSQVFFAADLDSISSLAGLALQRTTEEYFGEPKKVALKGIKEPVSYYALFWQATQENVTTQAAPSTESPTAPEQQPQKPLTVASPKSLRQKGTVSRFINAKGFGFIQYRNPDGSEDSIFFHKSSIVGDCEVSDGDSVRFIPVLDDHSRPHAGSVVVIGGTVEGRVARYDPDHFGFITVRDTDGNKIDFFVLPMDVQGAIAADSSVTFTIGETPRGLIAKDVKATDRSAVSIPGAEHLDLGVVEHGILDYADGPKGFGFIVCRGNRVFAHFTEVMDEERTLNKGDLVEFTVLAGKEDSYKASHIHVVEKSNQIETSRLDS